MQEYTRLRVTTEELFVNGFPERKGAYALLMMNTI